jgi:3-oxoacyl-[acyl-carrier protein] reductase
MDLGITDRVALIAGRKSGVLDACAQRLNAEGARVLLAELHDSDVDAVARETLDAHGPIGIVVVILDDHPGITLDAVTEPGPLREVWEPVVNAVTLYQTVAPEMQRTHWGRFVAVISAVVKTMPDDARDLELLSGLGMLGFHKNVARTLGPWGITANAVLREPGVPDDGVADAVTFLASDRASYLTGITIGVDAGRGRAIF